MRPRVSLSIAAAVALVVACGTARFPEEELPSPSPPFASVKVDAAPDVTATEIPDADVVDATVAVAVDADGDASDDAGVCDVRLADPPIVPSPHVDEGTPVVYATNPPSSGPHYPDWANFQIFDHPVDDPYLVHAEEHGAVLLLYKCPADADADANADAGDAGPDCTDIVAQLRAIRDALPDDPICDPSIRVRIIIAPRPANDTEIAAAAWGHTYVADCLDVPSLTAFVTAHYGQGPEQLCYQGSIF